MTQAGQVVVLTGGTGFVGLKLGSELSKKGFVIRLLSRSEEPKKLPFPAQVYRWNAPYERPPKEAFWGASAVIHLAGESVAASRWSDAVKKRIHDSRVDGTKNLVEVLNSVGVPTLVSASAIGFYGDQGDQWLDETSPMGHDFLAGVVQGWEQEANRFSNRKVILRFGVVLGKDGGALEKMATPFRFGVGSALGTGRQWMSWIHIDDLVKMILWSLEDLKVSGVLNAVSPNPVTNQELSEVIAARYGKWLLPRAPAAVLKIALGEMASFILGSIRVKPKRAVELGFRFDHADIKPTIADLISR